MGQNLDNVPVQPWPRADPTALSPRDAISRCYPRFLLHSSPRKVARRSQDGSLWTLWQKKDKACSGLLTHISVWEIQTMITPPAFSQRRLGDETVSPNFLGCLRFPIKICKNLGYRY